MEYGEKDDNGNIKISADDKDSIKKINDDLTAVLNSDVSINITKLKSGDIFNKGIKAEYLIGLYSIIEE